MKRVLVAGATGYLGKYAVRAFSNRGHTVRALSRPQSVHKLSSKGAYLDPPVREDIDELFVANATEPDTLTGLCDNIDIVFSSLGVTTQKASPQAVDYEANRTILDLATTADVEQFVFVSVHRPGLWGAFIEPRECFVSELEASSLSHTVVRPTGYFSDMTEIFKMARKGRVYLLGDGTARMNPIHGADLAKACVDAVDNARGEFAIGGPDVFTYNEIAELAFRALGAPPSVLHLPKWLVEILLRIVRPFNKRYAQLGRGLLTALTTDVIAPKSGTHTLEAHFEALAQRT